MVVVDNTTLEVVNLTVAVEEDTTIHRVAEAAVAAGKSILDEISSRPRVLRSELQPSAAQTVCHTTLTDGSGQEWMGGTTLVAGIAFGSWFKDASAYVDPKSAPRHFYSSFGLGSDT